VVNKLVSEQQDGQLTIKSLYPRAEARILSVLPEIITPLRFRIFLGYLFVFLVGLFGWEEIASAWRYLGALLTPVAALVGALFALKLSAVLVALVALFTSFIKAFFGFLVVVLKPGIIKAILIPQFISLLTWFHRKSHRLQLWFSKYYDIAKDVFERVVNWWRMRNLVDKILLSGFEKIN